MPIVRLIFVRVVPEEAQNAEQIWKESCAFSSLLSFGETAQVKR